MAEDSKKAFVLRLSDSLYADLACWAEEELRSVNGQVEYLLKEATIKYKRQRASRLCPECRKKMS